jgi:hypothetical protein
LKVSRTLVFSSSSLKSFWLGRQMTASAAAFNLLQAGVWAWRGGGPSKSKGRSGQGQNEGAAFAGDAGQDGSGAGAGAAAQAGEDEKHVRPGAEGSQAGGVVLGGGAAQLGIAAGAQAAGALAAEDPFVGQGRGGEGLGIGVEEQEITPSNLVWAMKPAALQPAPPTPQTLMEIFFLSGVVRFSGETVGGFEGGGHGYLLNISARVRLKPPARPPLAFAFLLERAEADQADGGGEFRLVQGGLQAADGIGLARKGGQLENVFGQGLDVRDARAAAAEEDAGAQALQPAEMGNLPFDQFENFLQAQGGDAVEVFQVDGLGRGGPSGRAVQWCAP